MGRKAVLIMAVGVFVGALAGGAMADIPGEYPQGEQILLASVVQEFVPEGNWAGTNWQASDLVEAVAIPVMVPEESWKRIR